VSDHSSKYAIVIPWKNVSEDPRRERAFEAVIAHYRRLEPEGIAVVVGTYEGDETPGTLNRARLRNRGAAEAREQHGAGVLAFIDADTWVPLDQIRSAFALADGTMGAVYPMDRWRTSLTEEQVEAVCAGTDPSAFTDDDKPSYLDSDGMIPLTNLGSPVCVVPVETYDAVGRFDEAYIGWGEEDQDFFYACNSLVGPTRCVPGHVFDLCPTSEHEAAYKVGSPESVTFNTNRARYLSKIDRHTSRDTWRAESERSWRTPRIAVYAPALNEAGNVEPWAHSASEADEIVLVDTGSTDGTAAEAERVSRDLTTTVRVSHASITPWRFDDGFNVALSQVSPDIDIAIPLHLDERLHPGWREELEKGWRAGGNQFTFVYHWGPELSFIHDRIHTRRGYRWIGAAHESLVGPGPKVGTGVTISQHRDPSKDRSQDPDLIHLAYQEDPNPRTAYYSGREYWYQNDWNMARTRLQEYLAMPGAGFAQERAEACRLIARMVWPEHREKWLLRAAYECPARREPWVDLADYYVSAKDPAGIRFAVGRAQSITQQTADNSFHLERRAWSPDVLSAMLAFADRLEGRLPESEPSQDAVVGADLVDAPDPVAGEFPLATEDEELVIPEPGVVGPDGD
jgi:glycosyltransferase involved in cell wall biosynthesis